MTSRLWVVESIELPTLSSRQVLTWIVRLNGQVANEVLGSVRPTREDLSDAAKAREAAGATRLVRRLLLRALAARILCRHVDEIRVERARLGSLIFPDYNLCASVSGSGDYAAIAVGGQSVGVDIEVLNAGPEASEEIRRWTALEAFLKAMGTGFGETTSDYYLSATNKGFALRDEAGRQGEGEWLVTPDFIAAAMTRSKPEIGSSLANFGRSVGRVRISL